VANSCDGQLLGQSVSSSLGGHETVVRMESKDGGGRPRGTLRARCYIFPIRPRRNDCECDRLILDSAAFAGLVLFGWNFVSVPAVLHAELDEKIASLESKLANLEQPAPNYAAIRHVDRLTLRDAAFYWCDLSPGRWMPSNVRDWYEALASAVRKGELDFEPKYSDYGHRETQRDLQKRNPDLGTIVKRTALQTFAKRYNHDPKFLRDA
jgi:hypothetical protein